MSPDARDLINGFVQAVLPLAIIVWMVVAGRLGYLVGAQVKEWARRRRERRLTGK